MVREMVSRQSGERINIQKATNGAAASDAAAPFTFVIKSYLSSRK